MKLSLSALAALAGVALVSPGTSLALEEFTPEVPIDAKEKFDGTLVSFRAGETGERYRNVTLIITGPRDYQAEVFSRDSLPSIPLENFGKLVDGVINYHMTAATKETLEIINPGLNNGRDGNSRPRTVGAQLSGRFCIKDGRIVRFKDILEKEK